MDLNEIFIVVVLYKTKLQNSETIISLSKIITFNFEVLVYDNSPESQFSESFFVYDNLKIQYINNTNNPGLATAYNYALEKAFLINKKWILLLDQDTVISPDYFTELTNLKIINKNVVSVIPRVNHISNNAPISPSIMYFGMFCRSVQVSTGIVVNRITAINSGTLLQIEFLKELHGFNVLFKLDYLDHWYFREIYKNKKLIYLMNVTIMQNLSIGLNNNSKVSIERYVSMLKGQLNYVVEEGKFKYISYKIILIIKVIIFNKLSYSYRVLREVFKK